MSYRRILRLAFLSTLVLIITISTPIFAQHQPQNPTTYPELRLSLQQGIKLYQQEQFSAAEAVWQQAMVELSQEEDSLQQALVLRYLSLVQQQQGDWETAATSIASSLDILNNYQRSPKNSFYFEILAKALNTQGQLQWATGKLPEAIATWETATVNYLRANNQEGAIGTKINQAQALQVLGLNRKAQQTLEAVAQILEREENQNIKAVSLYNLGKTWRKIGKIPQAQQTLQASLALAPAPNLESNILLELGNTERAWSDRLISIGKVRSAQQHQQAAMKLYQQAVDLSSPANSLEPLLNQLNFQVQTGNLATASQLWPKIVAQLANLPVSASSISVHLNLGSSLTCLKRIVDRQDLACVNSDRQAQLQEQLRDTHLRITTPTWKTIGKILLTARQQAQTLSDLRAESTALGQLGSLYELTEQLPEAKKLTQQALIIAQNTSAYDLLYLWQWQLGRILRQQGDRAGAIVAYTSAVETLKSLRQDLLAINTDLQSNFRDRVESIYRELVSLLLEAPDTSENLQQVIATIDSLQLAQLENFLGCRLPSTLPIEQNLDAVDERAALLYTIMLPNSLEVIYQLPGHTLKHHS